MPRREPVVLAADAFQLRHVGPKAAVWPDSPATPVTVLARTDMVARPLPLSQLPSSPDLAVGSWTGRLGDAGEQALTFPNKEASDGIPWRSRFDPTGHLQFIEIYYNGTLESCCVIDQIPTIDQTQVALHGSDGWFLLKKAYARDWITVQAPRDVIERGTGVYVPAVVDEFPAGALSSQWTVNTFSSTASAGIGPSGNLEMFCNAGLNAVTVTSGAVAVPATSTWRLYTNIPYIAGVAPCNVQTALKITVTEGGSGQTYGIAFGNGYVWFYYTGGGYFSVLPFPSAPPYSLLIESDGDWVWAFLNGKMLACFRRFAGGNATSLQVEFELGANNPDLNLIAFVSSVMLEAWQPFLQRGSDKGDYVLPGDASTYPSGGLHARYFNDLDLQSNPNALQMSLAPARTNAYLGSGGPEYMDQQDAQINSQNPPGFSQTTPGPGAAGLTNWSVVWFGAIYLKLSAGNYTFQWNNPGTTAFDYAVRIWVGKTRSGDQLVDGWTFGGSGSYGFTVSATALAGALPYGAGTVARDGWYPIRIEYAVGGSPASSGAAGALYLTSSPAAYTDPGGTSIASGSQSTVVPATSLSPLGCVDQRYQGVSHYDLVQQTVQAYGYQASVEPQQLESGLFPGVLAPRIREGHDSDIILAPDRGPLQDGEGILNYSSGLDATDFASSMQGNGAGFQNGNAGQLQAMVFDAATLEASLFNAQQWTDFSDASFTSLLQALLNAQLGLQLSPWQLLSADPEGRPKQAFTWPLPGAVAAMRWRPGDGLRIQAPDINVFDTTPRQMLTFTRNLLPLGIASSTASFALRPKTQARILKQQLYKATRWARNYQRQLVTLTGNFAIVSSLAAGATDTGVTTRVSFLASDEIVRARVVIVTNTTNQALGLLIDGTDVTTNLYGPWAGVPASIDVTSFAAPNQVVAQAKNEGGSATSVQYQVFVDVLR